LVLTTMSAMALEGHGSDGGAGASSPTLVVSTNSLSFEETTIGTGSGPDALTLTNYGSSEDRNQY
jgi:hypothetical protein